VSSRSDEAQHRPPSIRFVESPARLDGLRRLNTPADLNLCPLELHRKVPRSSSCWDVERQGDGRQILRPFVRQSTLLGLLLLASRSVERGLFGRRESVVGLLFFRSHVEEKKAESWVRESSSSPRDPPSLKLHQSLRPVFTQSLPSEHCLSTVW
jgi:hypothetical protein